MAKYLWGSACILCALSLVSALALGYVGWWMLLPVVLALGAFVMWSMAKKQVEGAGKQ